MRKKRGRCLPHAVRNMPPQFFFIVSRGGAVGVGEFKEVSWHKKEKENILRTVGVRVEYGEPIETGEYRGTFKTIGDQEHAEIIGLYVGEELGMHKIAGKLDRSSASVQSHIHAHNRAVKRSGFCPSCRRVKGEFEIELAKRG